MGTRQQPARRSGWLYQLPPWRAPRLRRHHHHHIHPVEAIFTLMGLFLFALFFFEIWMLEAMIWATIWFYYGAFLGARWVWRNNPIGQTIDTRAARYGRQQRPPYDPHGAPPSPIDLSALRTRTRNRSR